MANWRTAALLLAVGTVVVAGALSERRARGATDLVVPRDDATVLHAVGREAAFYRRELERALAHASDDDERVALIVRAAIEDARRSGDPRHLGRAIAALGPRYTAKSIAPRLRLLRATVRQSLHEFGGALADLDVLTAETPADPQVWLTRATVLYVVGRYADARASCAHLDGLAAPAIIATCDANVASVTGHARDAYAKLSALRGSVDARLMPWFLSTLGDVAERSGASDKAALHYREALALDATDRTTRAALADVLLDAGSPAEAAAILRGFEDDDGLLLRLAIAEERAGAPSATTTRQIVFARFAAVRERGDGVHRREEARYELEVERDPAHALTAARANFDVQREPADIRLLLEAALAAKAPEAARPALDLLATSGNESPRLRSLAERFRP